MITVDELKVKYPDASAWQMGDSPELANALAALIKTGKKTASCGSYTSYLKEGAAPLIGSYNIILDGQDVPVLGDNYNPRSRVNYPEKVRPDNVSLLKGS